MDVNVTVRDGVIILKPYGRIIGAAGSELGQVIKAHLPDAFETPKFLFDFADVARMDSTGLGALVGLHVTIVQQGGRIGVINVNKPIDQLLAMGKLLTVFEQFDSEAEAIADLQA